jgi:hypothetical protein
MIDPQLTEAATSHLLTGGEGFEDMGLTGGLRQAGSHSSPILKSLQL